MIYEIDELKELLKTAGVSYDAFSVAIDRYAWEVLSATKYKLKYKLKDFIRTYFDGTLEDALLQGEPDWLAYSEHGYSLLYDDTIAARFGGSIVPGPNTQMRNLQVAALERTPAYLHARAIYYYTHNV